MKLRLTLLACAASALVLAPVAGAHVEISPDKVPVDSDALLTIQVPNERNVPTVKLEIKLPAGLSEVTVQAKPGWTSSNKNGVVTWSGGKIGPGQFDEFGLVTHVPNTPGKEFVFPALQTYADGKVVRWIGTSTSDTPAPRITLVAASTTTTTTPAATATSDSGSDRDKVALGFGIAGLAAGLLALGVALLRSRRA
jgi:uncharacterized protein YcnI